MPVPSPTATSTTTATMPIVTNTRPKMAAISRSFLVMAGARSTLGRERRAGTPELPHAFVSAA